MNRVVGFLTLCVVCAILKAAVVALVAALMLTLLVSFITQPRDTLLLLATLALMGLASARPTAFIIAFGIIALAVVAAGARRRSQRRLLLTDGREHLSHEPARLDRDLLG